MTGMNELSAAVPTYRMMSFAEPAMAAWIRQQEHLRASLLKEDEQTILSVDIQKTLQVQAPPMTTNNNDKGRIHSSSDAQRRLSSGNTNITCEQASSGSSVYHCYDSAEAISIEENLMPLQPIRQCDTNEFTQESWAANEGCSNTCLLFSPNVGSGTNPLCQACARIEQDDDDENGSASSYVYDCRNLHPNAECPSRNSDGLCQEYEHWRCYRSPLYAGLGYICLPVNLDVPNAAFLYDEVTLHEAETWLYCTNDNTGKSAHECDNPACQIFTNPVTAEGCRSCRMKFTPQAFTTTITVGIPVDNNNNNNRRRINEEKEDDDTPLFSYDCSEVLPNLTCPILLANGTCANIPELEIRNYTYETVPSFVLSETTDDQNDDGPGWTLEFIDPTTFNVIIDIYDKIVMIIFGMAVALLFPVFMTWQIKRKKRVPVSTLGNVPDNAWSALNGLFLWRLSIPLVLLVTLVVASDFAHSVADAGLDFVTVEEQGSNKTALILGMNPLVRNNNTPIEIMGDPLNLRTFVYSIHLQEDNIPMSLPETELLDRYLSAVKLIARGESPFTRSNKTAWHSVGTDYGGLDSQAQTEGNGFLSTFTTTNEGSALVEMDSEIPLECYDMALAQLGRLSLGIEPFGRDMETIAAVPNCILTAERISGIFGALPSSPQIIEDLELRSLSYYSYLLDNVWLLKESKRFHSFQASPQSKQLARDRKDWRNGRMFYDIDGIQIGSEIIKFSSVSLGSGTDESIGLGPFVQMQASFAGEDLYEYALFGVVDGECPNRASGLQSDGEDCVVKILLACDRFPEDTATRVHGIYAPYVYLCFNVNNPHR